MSFFCRVAKETVEAEPMEGPVATWRETGGKIGLAKSVNASENGKDENEAEPGERDC